MIDASPDGLNEEKTKLLKSKLHDLFEHEIDPSYGFTQSETEETNKIHSGEEI